MKTILAPIDFSEATPAVVEAATDLAFSTNGRLVFLYVNNTEKLIAAYGGFADNIGQLSSEMEEDAERQMKDLRRSLPDLFETTATLVMTGTPVEVIVRQAKELSADYLVMGSHGHSALYDLVMGSTSSAVIKRAACPVVVIPPRKSRGSNPFVFGSSSSKELRGTAAP